MSKEEGNTTWSGQISSYRMVVEGFDWGPAVTALIIDLSEEKVAPSELHKADFEVSVLRKNVDSAGITDDEYCENRSVKTAYTSDADGVLVSEASSYITIELEVGPYVGNPFFCDETLIANDWHDVYQHQINYAGVRFIPKRTGKLMPLADLFDTTGKFTGSDGEKLLYAAHIAPSNINETKPLIIWLHGLGDGSLNGTVGSEIALLGNRVTRLVDDEIQDLMGGAHVLVPQAGTFWMDEKSGEDERQITTTGYSRYEKVLTELIEDFIANNRCVDVDRIYISGCSNGGFMTLRMLMLNPKLFAGAIPVCHGYHEDWIMDEEVRLIKDIPIWMVHAKNDAIFCYKETAQSLYDRLVAADSKNVFLTLDECVMDQTGLYVDEKGKAYEYDGHLSWIPLLNNDTKMKIDGKIVHAFEWLSLQKRNL